MDLKPKTFDVARTFEDAEDFLRANQYDLIILDYSLGCRKTGADLIPLIRESQIDSLIYANSAEYNDRLIDAGADYEFDYRKYF